MNDNFNPRNFISQTDEIIIVVLVLIVYFTYRYYPIPQYPLAKKDREPQLTNFWSEVAKNDTVVISVDLYNTDKPTTNTVKYWQRTELINDFRTNNTRILKFDRPLNNTITRYLVNCNDQTYQLINTIYTRQGDIVPRQREDKPPLAPKLLQRGTSVYYSARYACENKDIDIDEKIDNMPIEEILNAIL